MWTQKLAPLDCLACTKQDYAVEAKAQVAICAQPNEGVERHGLLGWARYSQPMRAPFCNVQQMGNTSCSYQDFTYAHTYLSIQLTPLPSLLVQRLLALRWGYVARLYG